MRIIKLKPLSVCDTNSYIIASFSGNCVLIDAPADADYILSQIRLNNLSLKKILLTHGHFDHIGAVADLVEKTRCDVYIHEEDLEKLLTGDGHVARYFGKDEVKKVKNVKTIKDDEVIRQDEMQFDVLHTPGHTQGSCCFIIDMNIFTGDTLFARSVGRTDLPGGDSAVLNESLKKIYDLMGNLAVYPGHMSSSTLDEERHYNPYLRGLGSK